jgi:hypothetical protein|tara:strand:+ start:104 stop:259 length:156 start_codon:yes stop_codon:yes gene_type:complete
MRKIGKAFIFLVFAYFGVNWVADNPRTIKKARRHMNKSVKHGKKAIEKTIK